METLDLTRCGARLERANKRHARELGRIMCPKNRDEVRASGNFSPEAALRMSINGSLEAYAVYAGDDLLMVLGVGAMGAMPNVHVVWSLTSVHVPKHAAVFWRSSKAILNYLRGKYVLMVNMVHAKNREAVRWVQRLGFTVEPPERFGVRGDLFCKVICHTPKIEVIHV